MTCWSAVAGRTSPVRSCSTTKGRPPASETIDWKNPDYRALFDERSEKLGLKIREATLLRVPYMLVLGDKDDRVQGLARRGEQLLDSRARRHVEQSLGRRQIHRPRPDRA